MLGGVRFGAYRAVYAGLGPRPRDRPAGCHGTFVRTGGHSWPVRDRVEPNNATRRSQNGLRLPARSVMNQPTPSRGSNAGRQ